MADTHATSVERLVESGGGDLDNSALITLVRPRRRAVGPDDPVD